MRKKNNLMRMPDVVPKKIKSSCEYYSNPISMTPFVACPKRSVLCVSCSLPSDWCRRVFTIYALNIFFFFWLMKPIAVVASISYEALQHSDDVVYIYKSANQPHFRLHIYTYIQSNSFLNAWKPYEIEKKKLNKNRSPSHWIIRWQWQNKKW